MTVLAAGVGALACGPGVPGNLEGFGELGDEIDGSETDPGTETESAESVDTIETLTSAGPTETESESESDGGCQTESDTDPEGDPATTGPTTAPRAPAAPEMPIGVERRVGGNSGSITAKPAAIVIEPPTPWTTRATISHPVSGARAQNIDPTAKIARRVTQSTDRRVEGISLCHSSFGWSEPSAGARRVTAASPSMSCT